MHITDIINGWAEINKECPSYRLGQHFINELKLQVSTKQLEALWNETSPKAAKDLIYQIIYQYNWSPEDLPEGK